jgi:hypothetical protein
VRREECCSFLIDNGCVVYEWRPLHCRLFGVDGRTQEDIAADAQREMAGQAHLLSALGVRIPDEILHYVIPRCDKVRNAKGLPLAIAPEPLLAAVIQLEAECVPPEVFAFEGEIGLPAFDRHLAMTVLGLENYEPIWIDAMRRYQAGSTPDEVTALVMRCVNFRFADLSAPR